MSTGTESAPLFESTAIPSPATRTYARPILTAIASAVVPGLGQVLQGRMVSGALWLSSFAGFLTLGAILRFPSTYKGALTFMLLGMTFNAAAAAHAFFCPVEKGRLRPQAAIVAVPLGFAFISACVLWALLFLGMGFKLFTVPSTSMTPTIEKGDQVVANMHAYSNHHPRRGEIVIIVRKGTFFVKRVIGLPDEVLSIDNGAVRIDDQPVDESYVEFTEGENAWGRNFAPARVPAGAYFVMGDDRDISIDSRSSEFGMVPGNEIKGQVLYIFGSERVGRRIDRKQPIPIPDGPA
jgi:signal peptidase I